MDRRHALMALLVVIVLCIWATWPEPARSEGAAGTPRHTATRPRAPHKKKPAHTHPTTTTRSAVQPVTLTRSDAPTARWVVDENARPGTRDWVITRTGAAHDIEGYADHVSAQAGDTVSLYVSTTAPTFHVEAYRMGWYGGLGGRLVWHSAELPGTKQAAATVVPGVNMVEARWRPSLPVSLDSSWPPGQYLFKLVGSTGVQRYVPLTVRDDASHAAFLVQSSVATWQAYNLWGGYSLYLGGWPDHPAYARRARIVSFDRPYDHDGAGDFVGNELPFVSYVESKGLDVTYWTDVDLERAPQLLLNHRALFTLGHDEYWSTTMRAGVELARDRGVNLAFLGANAMFRHVRFDASSLGPDRHIVDYKSASEDPTPAPGDKTVDWRAPPLNHPESTVIGEMYECNPVDADMVIADASSWIFAGTGLQNGAHLPHLIGTEYDRWNPEMAGPSNVAVLAHSPLQCQHKPSYSDMTYYSAPSGAGVFATGTGWWVNSLGTPATCPQGGCRHSDAVTAIMANVLAAFGQGPAGVAHPSVSNRALLPNRGIPARGEVSGPSAGATTTNPVDQN
ncbi:MAG TPA: N,N-dimethylformamidase beta subunit family domain-containing protein [Acidimicrobiia bacterium]|jgi:hypothetical protein